MLIRKNDNLIKKKNLLILDRDGTLTLNPVNQWILKSEDLELNFVLVGAMQKLNLEEWNFAVVTNQRCIALSLVSTSEYDQICATLEDKLKLCGIYLDLILTCPHEKTCTSCRKPNSEMVKYAIKALGGKFDSVFLIGDQVTDVWAAEKAGIKPYLLESNFSEVHNSEYISMGADAIMAEIIQCCGDGAE